MPDEMCQIREMSTAGSSDRVAHRAPSARSSPLTSLLEPTSARRCPAAWLRWSSSKDLQEFLTVSVCGPPETVAPAGCRRIEQPTERVVDALVLVP